MLISFTVENYRSFADEQTLSLEAVKDDSHPDHVVHCGKFSLLKSIAIYGSNASGKSNLLKAFEFMARFIRISATTMNLGDPIRGANGFRLEKARAGMPCSFDVRLLLNDTEYQYGFSATQERVHDEWIYARRKGTRTTNPLSRSFDPATGKTDWKLRGKLKNFKDITEKTRDNGLFLSRAAEMNVSCIKELFLWFQKSLQYLNFSISPRNLTQQTGYRIIKDDAFRSQVERLVHDADMGINGLLAKKESSSSLKFYRESIGIAFMAMAGQLESDGSDSQAEPPIEEDFVVSVQTLHKLSDSGDTVEFSLEEDESNGTQRFFGIVGAALDALDRGSLLIVDELDCSMHPHLTYKLVEMFQSAEANPKGAQLIFATHDTNLMTPSLFRRDQIWLTEKTQKGNTELFSLTDIESERRPRKEEPFEKNYLAGRYGGVPIFGPALEDIGSQ